MQGKCALNVIWSYSVTLLQFHADMTEVEGLVIQLNSYIEVCAEWYGCFSVRWQYLESWEADGW